MTTSDTACAPVNGLLRSLHSKRIGNWAVLAVLTVLALANPRLTSAQAVYGSVFGTVTDSTGAVVPNATVTVTDVVACPTVNWRSMVAVCPTETVIPLRISLPNPGAITVTEYSPAANSGIV